VIVDQPLNEGVPVLDFDATGQWQRLKDKNTAGEPLMNISDVWTFSVLPLESVDDRIRRL